MGTAMAVAKQGDFLSDEGKVEDIKPILIVDSVAAAAGGVFGASSITTFVESASGAADGGRSGLTSITAGILFLLAAFFSPLISCISSASRSSSLTLSPPQPVACSVRLRSPRSLSPLPAPLTAAVPVSPPSLRASCSCLPPSSPR